MENFICVQCGTQYSETAKPPLHCPICEDERQFVRHSGQEWTTLNRLAADHRNRFEEEAPRLARHWHRARICHRPARSACCNRRLEICSGTASHCWTIEQSQKINARGGIRAIAISHPHYYTTMIEWAERFDAQIFLHTGDHEWVMRKSPRIQFWEGTTLPLWDEPYANQLRRTLRRRHRVALAGWSRVAGAKALCLQATSFK